MRALLLIRILLLLLIGTPLIAHATPPTWADHPPEEYIVKRGDTLWCIAEKYLKEPWRWEEVWHANPSISDPNLIFPGDKIVIRGEGSHRTLGIARGKHWEKYHAYHASHKENGTEQNGHKLRPHIRVSKVDGAIPSIPLDHIRPFLNHSKVMTEDEIDAAPCVVALAGEHIVSGRGDTVYVDDYYPEMGKVFYFFREGEPYIDPVTHDFLGIEAEVVGEGQVVAHNDVATLYVSRSYREIEIGDRIIKEEEDKLKPFFNLQPPINNATGTIISVFGGVTQIGQYEVVVVTGGEDQNRRVGDVLAVYQKQKSIPIRIQDILTTNQERRVLEELPYVRVGETIVFRVFERVSFALVVRATKPMYLHDEVGRP